MPVFILTDSRGRLSGWRGPEAGRVTHVAPLPWAADVGETGGREALKQGISGGVRLLIPDMRISVDVGPIADELFLFLR